jgi:Protein of unknown function (DUF3631)/Primase C terminal 2 (PriCT-2)/Bifunctional DNA primase/polymerase, N-terminal
VKAAGGMVIAPPSRKANGQQYRWLYDYPIADAPEWLIKLCINGSGSTAGNGNGAKSKKEKPPEELLAADLDKLAFAVGVIPNDLPGYKEWKRLGMAVYAATGGSDFGFSLFDGFSKRWTSKEGKYNADNVQKAWSQIATSPPKRIGAQWIYDRAGEAHPGWRTGYEDMRAKTATPEDRAKAEEERAKQNALEEEMLANLVKIKDKGLEYARKRKEAQEDLGVSARDIDNEVKRRAELDAAPMEGYWIVEPWDESVDGDCLLRDINNRIRRHVVCSHDVSLAASLWVMFSWVHDEIAVYSPILLVTSPAPECGKGQLLGLIKYLAPRAMKSVDISKSALYRSIMRWHPSFIIDEFDTVLASKDADKSELRAVINAGHTRGDGVIRCITDEHTPELFHKFAPKALGMIGRRMPASTLSRCIILELIRRTDAEKIDPFNHEDDSGLADLRRRLLRWSLDNQEALREVRPAMPDGFSNRRGDNWRFLIAIADACAGVEEWGEKARIAAANLESENDAVGTEIRLLIDIKRIRDENPELAAAGCILSAKLVELLKADEEAPWAGWSHGKGLTQNGLATLLSGGGGRGRAKRAGYGIQSSTVHPAKDVQGKGYKWSQFEDIWERLLPKEVISTEEGSQEGE